MLALKCHYFMTFRSQKACMIFLRRLLNKTFGYLSSLSLILPSSLVSLRVCVCLCVLTKARLSLSTLTRSLTKSVPRLVASKPCWSPCLCLSHGCRCRCQFSHIPSILHACWRFKSVSSMFVCHLPSLSNDLTTPKWQPHKCSEQVPRVSNF